jgi:hypothetical protein
MDFMIVIIAALMFLVPTMKREAANRLPDGAGFARKTLEARETREAQEEEPRRGALTEDEALTFRVTLEVHRREDEGIADILWMKKAAAVALSAGIPYFNVREQRIRSRPADGGALPVVDGVIALDEDPMRAEYDAHEIDALVLPDYPRLEK